MVSVRPQTRIYQPLPCWFFEQKPLSQILIVIFSHWVIGGWFLCPVTHSTVALTDPYLKFQSNSRCLLTQQRFVDVARQSCKPLLWMHQNFMPVLPSQKFLLAHNISSNTSKTDKLSEYVLRVVYQECLERKANRADRSTAWSTHTSDFILVILMLIDWLTFTATGAAVGWRSSSQGTGARLGETRCVESFLEACHIGCDSCIPCILIKIDCIIFWMSSTLLSNPSGFNLVTITWQFRFMSRFSAI